MRSIHSPRKIRVRWTRGGKPVLVVALVREAVGKYPSWGGRGETVLNSICILFLRHACTIHHSPPFPIRDCVPHPAVMVLGAEIAQARAPLRSGVAAAQPPPTNSRPQAPLNLLPWQADNAGFRATASALDTPVARSPRAFCARVLPRPGAAQVLKVSLRRIFQDLLLQR